MTAGESVVYVLPDKMGGAMTIIANLLQWRGPDRFAYHAILTHNHEGVQDTRMTDPLKVDTRRVVEFRLPIENVYAVLRRLASAVPPGDGVYVTNDLLDVAMLHVHDTGRAVVMIVHGDYDYYYDLAVRHESVVDLFVGYSRAVCETLRRRLPWRAADVRHLPYGVAMPARMRTPAAGPLRVVYAGRLDVEKGVMDLPVIDDILRLRGIDVEWTIAGDGPAGADLRARWSPAAHVRWLGSLPNAKVLALGTSHDVFVLPSRAEGFPVAMVEGMASGLVPVVSDLRSGVSEVVDDRVSGFRPPVGDVAAFADAVATLANDRTRLEAMSRAARERVETQFEIRQRAAAYQAMYADWRTWKRQAPVRTPLPYGSRLDRAWLPNAIVRTIRRAIRARRRHTSGGAR